MPAFRRKTQSDSYSDELLLQQILTNLKNLLDEELAVSFCPPVPPQTRERNSTTTTQQMNEHVNQPKHPHSVSTTTSLAYNYQGSSFVQGEVGGSTPQSSKLQTRAAIGSFELGSSGDSEESSLVPQTPTQQQFPHNFYHAYDSDSEHEHKY